jgi:hypothetical protein
MAQGRNLLADEPSTGRNLLADEVPVSPNLNAAFEPVSSDTGDFDVAKIPESTAYGTAFGLAMPEIMRYGGKALQFSPYGQPAAGTLGRSMEVSGEALRGRRTASAVTGGVGGFTGETGYQLARSMGAPEPVATGVGIVSGMVGPTAIGRLAARSPFLGEQIRKAEETGFGEAVSRFASRLRGGKPAESRAAMEQVVRALEDEAQVIRTRGQQQADQIMSTAEAEIARLGPGAAQQAADIRRRATDQAAAVLFRARQQVDQRQRALRDVTQRMRFGEQTTAGETARRAVGQPAEATDVGESLRQRITSVQGQRIKARSDQATADKKAVTDEVNLKQSSGEKIADRDDYKGLINELEQRLGIGEVGKAAPFAEMTEPRTRRTFQEIYSVLKPTQSEVEGVVRTPEVSFESLDALRRRLGEVYRSPPAEGAAALDSQIAGDFYKKLSQVLGEYSPAQKQFISNYEQLSKELNVFKGAAGRKATAIDRYDPEAFVTDPAKLPANYFSTRTAVQDLIELTGGDKPFVEKQAASFVARQLEGVRTPQAAAEFEARNRDWLREFPALKKSVDDYVEALRFAETRGTRLTGAAKALRTEIGELPIRARKEAADVRKAAEAEAKAAEGVTGAVSSEAREAAKRTKAAAMAQARMLDRTPKQDQVRYFDSLISSGDTDVMEAASTVIKRSPELQDSFLEGARITLSRMDPREVGDKYRREVRPALEKLGLASASQLNKIDQQIRLIETAGVPELRPGLAMTAIRNTLAATAGMSTSRLMDALGLSFAEPTLGGPGVTR